MQICDMPIVVWIAIIRGLNLQTDQRKDPNLDMLGRSHKASQTKGLHFRIIAIFVDTSNNKVTFIGIEKLPGLVRFLRKIDQEEVGQEGCGAGNLECHQ